MAAALLNLRRQTNRKHRMPMSCAPNPFWLLPRRHISTSETKRKGRPEATLSDFVAFEAVIVLRATRGRLTGRGAFDQARGCSELTETPRPFETDDF